MTRDLREFKYTIVHGKNSDNDTTSNDPTAYRAVNGAAVRGTDFHSLPTGYFKEDASTFQSSWPNHTSDRHGRNASSRRTSDWAGPFPCVVEDPASFRNCSCVVHGQYTDHPIHEIYLHSRYTVIEARKTRYFTHAKPRSC